MSLRAPFMVRGNLYYLLSFPQFLIHSCILFCHSRESGNLSSLSLRDLHSKSWQSHLLMSFPHYILSFPRKRESIFSVITSFDLSKRGNLIKYYHIYIIRHNLLKILLFFINILKKELLIKMNINNIKLMN